jgi:hypothetical protein
MLVFAADFPFITAGRRYFERTHPLAASEESMERNFQSAGKFLQSLNVGDCVPIFNPADIASKKAGLVLDVTLG